MSMGFLLSIVLGIQLTIYNNLMMMKLIDEQYTLRPFYGVPRMTAWLRRGGHLVNPKRVRRLMGLEAIYPKPRLSQSCPGHKRYPYLLKGLVIDHSDQVWCSDINYIRLLHGFVYLTVVMDWFSRYVLSWELSITLDTENLSYFSAYSSSTYFLL